MSKAGFLNPALPLQLNGYIKNNACLCPSCKLFGIDVGSPTEIADAPLVIEVGYGGYGSLPCSKYIDMWVLSDHSARRGLMFQTWPQKTCFATGFALSHPLWISRIFSRAGMCLKIWEFNHRKWMLKKACFDIWMCLKMWRTSIPKRQLP